MEKSRPLCEYIVVDSKALLLSALSYKYVETFTELKSTAWMVSVCWCLPHSGQRCSLSALRRRCRGLRHTNDAMQLFVYGPARDLGNRREVAAELVQPVRGKADGQRGSGRAVGPEAPSFCK